MLRCSHAISRLCDAVILRSLCVCMPELSGLYILGEQFHVQNASGKTVVCEAGVFFFACMCVLVWYCVCFVCLRAFCLASGEVERWKRSESVQ